MKVSVIGVPQTMAFLKVKAGLIDKQTKESMQKVGRLMQNEVKASISKHRAEPLSVDTGTFLRSVDFSATAKQVVIFSLIPYAKFLEYGTRRMPARRHFNNSLNRNKQKAISILKEGINI